DAKAVIALTTRLGDSGRPSLSPTRWDRFATALADAGLSPADVFSAEFDPALPGVAQDVAESVRALLADAAAATVAAAELDQMGIWTLTIVDDGYPAALSERLGRLAPPILYGAGPAALLAEQGIAIVGSRNVDEAGAVAAGEVARVAVEAGYTVVSGGARGVDQLAMNAAFMGGGRVLGVLADSLQARIRKPDVLRALDSGTTALITQQVPLAGFTPGSAMGRNKLIYALSRVTMVIASDLDTGGTWAGAVEALKAKNGVVAVWRGPGEGPGNERLAELGAVPVRTADEVLACLDIEPPAPPEQLSWME
ncbi:MAG: DNA-protecting protein DprA, partial [Acidimicrobiia bacterium]|nr:DNA-protecting protein DprA [Acidimicrobiia bacterium]